MPRLSESLGLFTEIPRKEKSKVGKEMIDPENARIRHKGRLRSNAHQDVLVIGCKGFIIVDCEFDVCGFLGLRRISNLFSAKVRRIIFLRGLELLS